MNSGTTSFAALLRQFRTAAALSQAELAERAGVSLRGISDLERGVRRAPHLTTVRMIADALALTPDERQALLATARPAAANSPMERDAGHAPLSVPLTGRERELAALVSLLRLAGIPIRRMPDPTPTGRMRQLRLTLEEVGRTFVLELPAETLHNSGAIARALGSSPGPTHTPTLRRFDEAGGRAPVA